MPKYNIIQICSTFDFVKGDEFTGDALTNQVANFLLILPTKP